MNPLSALKLDGWYKGMLVLSSVLFILSLTVEFKAADQTFLQLLFGGLVLIGFGEWINHPDRTGIVQGTWLQPGYVMTGRPRDPVWLGRLFNLAGIVIISCGLWRVF